jgi:hypothetical protein
MSYSMFTLKQEGTVPLPLHNLFKSRLLELVKYKILIHVYFCIRFTYAGMAEELFGIRGKQWVDFVQILYSVGAIVGYMVLIG